MNSHITLPDFRELRAEAEAARTFDAGFESIFSGAEELKTIASEDLLKRQAAQARLRLADISVTELTESRAGIRTAALTSAGYRNLGELDQMTDPELISIPGIGEKQAASIRSIIASFVRSLSERERVLLTDDASDPEGVRCIRDLARYRKAEMIVRDAEEIRQDVHALIRGALENICIRSRFRWLFSGREKKERTCKAAESLKRLTADPLCQRAQHFQELYEEAAMLGEEDALADFRKNSASYYALIEKLTGTNTSGALLYSSIPEQLAAEISEEPLDTDVFRGDLRAYQEFGARYILHQKRVLLGDEMGLGKTIQAIAAMAHLHKEQPESHFLIVCPASVMTNWCRELRKFSRIETYLLHGESRDAAFGKWQEHGGAAVTSYEGMEMVAKGVNNRMRLALFVVDEAHYIKNPEAKRTKRIRLLEDESDRILLMTGTPLENRVEEMCELIRFVRPDLEADVRAKAVLRNIPAFREMLSPVYLRRKRDQVLSELPPVTESEEWCEMTPSDLTAYEKAVGEGSFMAMRRVSFLQEDLTSSSKAVRLRELCDELRREGRKMLVYSYFRETIRKAEEVLLEFGAYVLTGSTPVEERQRILDAFAEAPDGAVLLAQIQAGGTGLNLQAASAVIFLEPQIKPSLVSQAVSRVLRMGQIRNVLVCHLLCADTVDEAVRELVKPKQEVFDLFAEESALAEAEDHLADREWIRRVVENERVKYLPAVIDV